MRVPEQGQSTAVLAPLTYFPWGGEREEGREEFDLLSPRASNSLRHQMAFTEFQETQRTGRGEWLGGGLVAT